MKPSSNSNSILDLWVQFKKQPELSFGHSESQSGKYIAMLVERGPPGCNLNYPICSILYPKSTIPFLANYPNALTFRNLHSKFMKVSEVIIERMGAKQNVKEIKEGYIYFTNDGTVQSQKYHFSFSSETESRLAVQINENFYWKNMIIEPVYPVGKKLPYEIGFVGAKGTTIDADEYERAWHDAIEENIFLYSTKDKSKLSYTISSFESRSAGTVKISLRVPADFDIAVQNPYLVKTQWNSVMMCHRTE